MSSEILEQTCCELGEGPTYDPVQNKAWWFDIVAKQLFEHDFESGCSQRHALPFMASMLAVVDENTQLVAAEDGLYLREVTSHSLTLQQPLEADNSATRSNDGRVHASGALWIGTMGKGAEHGAGAIYWYYRGELRKLYPAISIPNAICFSPDARTAYYTDSPTARLMRVAVDPINGFPLSDPQVLFEYQSPDGAMDGAVNDADGNIWIACWGAGCVIVVSPAGELSTTVHKSSFSICISSLGKAIR